MKIKMKNTNPPIAKYKISPPAIDIAKAESFVVFFAFNAYNALLPIFKNPYPKQKLGNILKIHYKAKPADSVDSISLRINITKDAIAPKIKCKKKFTI